RHCKRAERLSNLRAPRPARLPKPKPMIIKIKPADSRYERGTEGGQVIFCIANICAHLSAPVKSLKIDVLHYQELLDMPDLSEELRSEIRKRRLDPTLLMMGSDAR
ncbi:hypothetical protein AB9K34_13095, partial [Sedimentitalea sp. XS_ASV28]|uniref:hypothetical protein n=1 Tax=Sedimentitalea sp. XS_ASV28 TaxID=3241296 RepID=UPI003513BD31